MQDAERNGNKAQLHEHEPPMPLAPNMAFSVGPSVKAIRNQNNSKINN